MTVEPIDQFAWIFSVEFLKFHVNKYFRKWRKSGNQTHIKWAVYPQRGWIQKKTWSIKIWSLEEAHKLSFQIRQYSRFSQEVSHDKHVFLFHIVIRQCSCILPWIQKVRASISLIASKEGSMRASMHWNLLVSYIMKTASRKRKTSIPYLAYFIDAYDYTSFQIGSRYKMLFVSL